MAKPAWLACYLANAKWQPGAIQAWLVERIVRYGVGGAPRQTSQGTETLGCGGGIRIRSVSGPVAGERTCSADWMWFKYMIWMKYCSSLRRENETRCCVSVSVKVFNFLRWRRLLLWPKATSAPLVQNKKHLIWPSTAHSTAGSDGAGSLPHVSIHIDQGGIKQQLGRIWAPKSLQEILPDLVQQP